MCVGIPSPQQTERFLPFAISTENLERISPEIFHFWWIFFVYHELKFCSLDFLSWTNWTTISGTITWVLLEVCWSKPWLCSHEVKNHRRDNYRLVAPFMGRELESNRHWGDGICSTTPLGGKAHYCGLGKDLSLFLFLFDAWPELSPPAKGRVRFHRPRVDLDVTESLFCSFIQKKNHRSLRFTGEAATYKGDSVPEITKLMWSCTSFLSVCASFCPSVKW